MTLQAISQITGLNVVRIQQVHGGDINAAWCIETPADRFFLKLNDAVLYPGMFEQEAMGLEALSNAFVSLHHYKPIMVPGVVKHGVSGDTQFLLLEWMQSDSSYGKDFWENFGSTLAAMHRLPNKYFGWDYDNYIGSLRQKNTRQETWDTFFAQCRIQPLAKKLFEGGQFSKQDLHNTENFCTRIGNLFPVEPASLLHGDLWSGNFMAAGPGMPALFDPAVYYGHREMDIGMTKLFGGFDNRFYEAYHAAWPLEKGWQQRLDLTQLYPLLVHAVLFGGHYVGRSREIIRKF